MMIYFSRTKEHNLNARMVYPGKWLIISLLGIWLLYTIVQSLMLSGMITQMAGVILGFVPGILAIWVLRSEGLTWEGVYLRFNPISLKGLFLFTGFLVFYWLVVIPTGSFVGWRAGEALFFAPLGAISQEIFFRSSLLPALCLVFPGRFWVALSIHAVLFGLWHIGAIFAGAPWVSALPVMLVPFLFGLGWGWQVWHDRTVVWSILHHTLLLVIMSFYIWG